MSLQETVRYTVDITLTTEQGECPTADQAEEMIFHWLGGGFNEDGTEVVCEPLTEDTGLTVLVVEVKEVSGEL